MEQQYKFITRSEDGRLQSHILEWDSFVEGLLGMAKNTQELEFIGQFVEDLQICYEQKLEEFEEDI